MRAAAVLLLTLVLAGCGAGGRGHGTATLWVTRDRGAHVVFSGSVPAGLNGIQAVERKLKVSTRYGGRYVQSIAGTEGSLSGQRDWFWYRNGIDGDRSAAEIRLRPGDVIWWDYHRWTPATERIPAVPGAWPHPFSDGPTTVVAQDRALARKLASQVHGDVNAKAAGGKSVVLVGGAYAPGHVAIRPFHGGYLLELGRGVAQRLADDPTALRYRF